MNEQDCGLLELATKAGINVDISIFDELGDFPFEYLTFEGEPWNPLDDDGDALRLAVKLGMLFTYMHDRFDMFQRFYLEELDKDKKPSEATRHAIVRAAFEITRTMP